MMTTQMTKNVNAERAYRLRDLPKSPQLMVRIAAGLYIIIFFAALFGAIYVPSVLVLPDDPASTVSNLTESIPLYRAGTASYLIILISEIMLTVLLYVLFKPVNATISLVAAAFRLAMTIVHGINILFQFLVSTILANNDYLAAFEVEQVHALTFLTLDIHEIGWTIGIIFFSFHVLILGYLVFQSGYVPKVLGIALVLASISYFLDSSASLFLDNYDSTPTMLALFIVIAELAFPLWLLIKGINVKAWQQRIEAAA
ncbi:MAG: DUF4386 domain-containing protein [Chloroflexota bacterium]